MAGGGYDEDGNKPADYTFNIMLNGDSGVGKSQIMTRFTRDKFSFNFEATVGYNCGYRTLVIEDMRVDVRIWDLAGFGYISTIAFYPFADGAILVYDITKRESLDHIIRMMEDLHYCIKEDAVIILIGNKSDLESERAVLITDSQEFARKEGLLFLETSALDGTNVETAFLTLLTTILHNRPKKKHAFARNDQDKDNPELLKDEKIELLKIPAKRKVFSCMDLTEPVFGLLPNCHRSKTSKRLTDSFELLKLKVELLLKVRDAVEEHITKELMLGKNPMKESQIWLTRVETVEPQVQAILELEHKGSQFDASLYKRLMNLLDEIVECLEKSPLELDRMVDAPYDKSKSRRKTNMTFNAKPSLIKTLKFREQVVIKAKPDKDTGISPSQGNETAQKKEMRLQRRGTSSKHTYRAGEFSLSELAAATNNFSLENKIGTGSFGVVYKGKLSNGREVAIKRSDSGPRTKKFQEKESAFDSELAFLSRLHHKHLIGLVGFCEENDEMLFVYDFMKNGALYDHLHDKNNVEKNSSLVNSWKVRIKIALDAARGIEYLHNYAVPPIIHRDIKSSNILLDANWIARVAGLGLCMMNPESDIDYRPMKVAGTVGYIDPEYYALNVLTAKSDVYGLGIVLLELLTGKRAIFKNGDHGGTPVSVVDFAVPAIMAGELCKILDSRVEPPELNESEAVELVAYTAMHCVNLEGKNRPTMTDIVHNLERALVLCADSPGRISSASMDLTEPEFGLLPIRQQKPKDVETLIAPSVDWSIPVHEIEKTYDIETGKGLMMQRHGSEAQTVSSVRVGGSMAPALLDELEAESTMSSFAEIAPVSSIKPAANPEIISRPRTEILVPRETEIEIISFKAEEVLLRPETEILSIHESNTDSVSFVTQEVDQVEPILETNLNRSTESSLPVAVAVAGPVTSGDDTLLADQPAMELHFQTEGGHVLEEPGTKVKRSIQHNVHYVFGCIKDMNTRRIGLYGTGGIGKTTILKSLISYPELKGMFDSIIWVTVSRYWTTRKIQNEIVRQLDLSAADSETDTEIAEKLFQALRSRRFLLLLDDVWDWIDIDSVGIPDTNKGDGCRIMITTRSLDVCHIMAADREIKVEGLSRDEAWGLFHEQLGKIIDSPDIHPFARGIVDGCGGLPLTIIVTGKALRDEEDVLVWRHALKEFFLPSPAGLHGTEAVVQQLKFSYDRLRAQEIKSFFLYCALFPEDHEINISAVIDYCIQEGLVAGDLGDAHKKGHNIVGLLVSAALLERNKDGLSVKMHDVIRDLALWVLVTDAEASPFLVGADLRLTLTQPPSIGSSSLSRSLESSGRNKLLLSEDHQFLLRAGVGLTKPPSKKDWENAKMICLMDNQLSSLPETPSCPNLLALFLQRNNLLRVIPRSFFDCMPSLQVLNLSETRIKSLPPSLSKLISLQALILRNCDRLAMLPSEVGLLWKLEILDLQGTEINKLANEIGNLIFLKHLEVSFYGSTNRCENAKLPPELIPCGMISSLIELEKLSVVVCPGDQRWIRSVESFISEVGSLTNLTLLCVYFPEVEFLKHFLQMSPSWKVKGLTKFKFIVGHNVKRIVARVPEDVDSDFGRRGQCLRFVNSDMIPEAVVEVLTRTTAFYLDHHLNIGSLSEFGLGNMKMLEFCVVRECPMMHTIIEKTDVPSATLPFLERLSIHYLCNLRRIWEDIPSGSFARLRILSVHSCLKLNFVFSYSMLQCVAQLEELVVEDCPAITEIIIQDNVLNPGIMILLGLKKLKLHYLPRLASIWKGPWPLLEQISFYNCSNLKNIGMDTKLKHTLKEIKGEKDWWDALEWEETALFLHLQPRFSQITDDDL